MSPLLATLRQSTYLRPMTGAIRLKRWHQPTPGLYTAPVDGKTTTATTTTKKKRHQMRSPIEIAVTNATLNDNRELIDDGGLIG